MARHVARRLNSIAGGLPQWIRPQLTELVDEAPNGPQWLHEIKFDRYRMHARIDCGSIAADHQQWSSSGALHAAPCREREIIRLRHYAATGSIRLESLFLTLPTRVLTGQHVIFSDG